MCLDIDTERILVITIDQGGIMRSCWSNCLDIRPIVFQWSEDISLASHLTMETGEMVLPHSYPVPVSIYSMASKVDFLVVTL